MKNTSQSKKIAAAEKAKKSKKVFIAASVAAFVFALTVAALVTKQYLDDHPKSASSSAETQAGAAGSSAKAVYGDTGLYPDFFTYFYKSEQNNYVFGEKFFYEAVCTPLEKKEAEYTNYFDPHGKVPGLPFLFDYDHTQNIKTGYTAPDSVIITYSDGICSTLVGDSGVTFESGKTFERPVTVYWNPYTDPDGKADSNGTVTAVFMYKGKEIGRQSLNLQRHSSTKTDNGSAYRYRVIELN